MCDGGHALFRTYEAGCWYLTCCMCPHRILEGRTEAAVQDLPIPDEPITPEEVRPAA